MDASRSGYGIISQLIVAVQASMETTTPINLDTLLEIRASLERLSAWASEAKSLLTIVIQDPPVEPMSLIRHKIMRLIDEWESPLPDAPQA